MRFGEGGEVKDVRKGLTRWGVEAEDLLCRDVANRHVYLRRSDGEVMWKGEVDR